MSSALLLPRSAVPESRLVTGAAGTELRATAHVDFKIIIPPVLFMDVSEGAVRIISNSRTVTLAAGAGPFNDARGNGILSAVAHKVIAQHAACTLGALGAPNLAPKDTRAGVTESTRVFCTVSMP